MKILIALAFVAILGALGSAGWFMLRKRDTSQDEDPTGKRMANALAWRIGLSVALFLFILLSYLLGWIHPTGIPIH